MSIHPYIFIFEKEDERFSTLEWIPLAVRFQLDKLSKKLSLGAWQSFPIETRQELTNLSLNDTEEGLQAFDALLTSANILYNGSVLKDVTVDSSVWQQNSTIPSNIQEQCTTYNVLFSQEQWDDASTFVRYAFHKATTGRDGSVLAKLLRELKHLE